MSTGVNGRIPLASYSFDPSTRFLYRNSVEIRLPRKAGDLLAVLVADLNALVPRQEIFALVWPEGFVEDGNLTQTVYLLRRSLAADPAITIENVPRRGYRLRVLEENALATHRKRLMSPRIVAIGLLVSAALVSVGAWAGLQSSGAHGLPLRAREDMELAMYHFDRFENLRLARTHFELMTKDAPTFPDGYAGLALVDAIDGYDSPNRRSYCILGRRTLARTSALGMSTLTHVSSAMLYITCDRSLIKARRELDAALAVDPLNATALTIRSRVALWEGRPRQAISFANAAAASDPISPEALLALGITCYYGGDLASARSAFKRLLELMPSRPVGLDFLARSDEGLGDYASADRVLREAERDPSNADWVNAARARLLAVRGHRRSAIALLKRWAARSDPESRSAGYAALGNAGAAIRSLKIAASRHSLNAQIAWLDDVRFASLRRDFPQLSRTFVTWH